MFLTPNPRTRNNLSNPEQGREPDVHGFVFDTKRDGTSVLPKPTEIEGENVTMAREAGDEVSETDNLINPDFGSFTRVINTFENGLSCVYGGE